MLWGSFLKCNCFLVTLYHRILWIGGCFSYCCCITKFFKPSGINSSHFAHRFSGIQDFRKGASELLSLFLVSGASAEKIQQLRMTPHSMGPLKLSEGSFIHNSIDYALCFHLQVIIFSSVKICGQIQYLIHRSVVNVIFYVGRYVYACFILQICLNKQTVYFIHLHNH